ncbi:MAG: heme-binding protein [Candidatus Rokubacteria bacterium]|nr:heme-binding protein [Candidatus Rokubacteria bacterium]
MSTITKRTIDAATAGRAIDAAAAKARGLGVPMCIAVCDDAGHLKAFLRMDGAPLLSLEIAQNKAYTAVGYGVPTHAWHDFIKSDPPLLTGIPHTPRLVIFGGGYPIKDGDQVLGAIGVSGGHYTQDMECATAALQAIGAPA